MEDKIDYFSQNQLYFLSLFITAINAFMAGPAGAKITDTNLPRITHGIPTESICERHHTERRSEST